MTRQSPGFLYASLRVFDVSISEMLWSRRTVFMGLVVGLPVLIAVAVRLLIEMGAPLGRVNNVTLGGQTIFGCICALKVSRRTADAASISFADRKSLGSRRKMSMPREISEP